MTEYQVTYWRELPSMVVARDDSGEVTKASLSARFQGAVDEAAMRLGETSSDAYLDGWRRGEWTEADGDRADVVTRVVADLEAQWDEAALTACMDDPGGSPG